MDEMDEYQEWLFLTWGYGSDATYLTKGLLRMRDTNQGVTHQEGYLLVGNLGV